MGKSSKRKQVSQGLRFDIFNRDGFTCQYCGRRPPEVVLELDHVVPVALGGGNEEMNLTTSCSICNAGKSAKILGAVKPTPDADTQYLKAEQQRLEYLRYLKARDERDALQNRVIEEIQDVWCTCFNSDDTVTASVIIGWLNRFDPYVIERGIELSVPAFQQGKLSNRNFPGMVKYTSAVMRNIAESGEAIYGEG